MSHFMRRAESVVDVRTTADIARLGRWLALFQALVVAGTGWYVAPELAGPGSPVAGPGPTITPAFPGWSLFVASGFVFLVLATVRLPWNRWRPLATAVYPLTSFALLGSIGHLAPAAAPAYVGLLSLWFLYVGVTAPLHTGVKLAVPAGVVWLMMTDRVGPEQIIRLGLAVVVWVVLAEALALRTSASRNRTTELEIQAETDALTGLPNRRAFDLALAGLRSGDVLAVIDLDHFKAINDSGGHAHGDRVLIDFAQTLTTVLRGSDLVCRYGGEEFVLILPSDNSASLGVAAALARLRGRWHAVNPDVTWSGGVSCHVAGQDPQLTLREADRALYEAKLTGRDRVVAAGRADRLAGVGRLHTVM